MTELAGYAEALRCDVAILVTLQQNRPGDAGSDLKILFGPVYLNHSKCW